MTVTNDLAARFRQAVQGCTLHIHGPVQAWRAVVDAAEDGTVEYAEVGRRVCGLSFAKVATMRGQGVTEDDPRIAKERSVAAFAAALFGCDDPFARHAASTDHDGGVECASSA